MAPSDPDACTTFASQFDTCTLALTGEVMLSGGVAYTYDTSMGELTADAFPLVPLPIMHMMLDTRGKMVDAILARTVRLTAGTKLHAVGPRGLAIVASESIILEDGAAIDVNDGGAGMLSLCSSPPSAGAPSSGGGGGGGGGGYGDGGGTGGKGNGGAVDGGMGPSSIGQPAGPQGGCAGAKGGDGDVSGGAGGGGGGALYLVAGKRIELGDQAAVLASGGGGRGGTRSGNSGDAGGGGGGSGGMILLEAPQLLGPQAVVAANGGGGGEGSSSGTINLVPGNNGETGLPSSARALGGKLGTPDGADGGLGGSHDVKTGESVTEVVSAGGGGGGGGVGYIVIVSDAPQLGTVSPPPQAPR